VSTARTLSDRYHFAKVLVIDKHAFPCPYTASIDSSRIVRADYADPAYSTLGQEALKQWAGHPAFRKTGLVITADGENKYLKDSYNNVKSEGGVEYLPTEKDIRSLMAGGCSGTSGYVNWNRRRSRNADLILRSKIPGKRPVFNSGGVRTPLLRT